MDKKEEILAEYTFSKEYCRIHKIGYEKHNTNERYDLSQEFIKIRFDCYTTAGLQEMKLLFRGKEVLKAKGKTIGGQYQYLIQYNYKLGK